MSPTDRFSRKPLDARAPGIGLRGVLRAIDGGPFQTYRRILGEHELGEFSLTVESVPPDALGGPARLRLSIDRARAGLTGVWSHGDAARLVLEDALLRAALRAVEELAGPTAASAPGSGRVWIEPCGPGIASRTSATVSDARVELGLAFDLPASERRVRGLQAESILFEHLPKIGMAALLFPMRRVNELKPQIEAAARSRAAAAALPGRGLVAILPPALLPGGAAPGDAVTTVETSHGPVTGLAIPTGVSLFLSDGVAGAGGWLRDVAAGPAIFAGPVAVIRSSRRAFGPLDLSAFVTACPEAPEPTAYSAEDAPAPLALVASLVEAIEAGARILVLDEDDAPAGAFATDVRLTKILGGAPRLHPLASRLAELRDRWELSFLVAVRSAGSLLDAADSVFVLRDHRIEVASGAHREKGRDNVPRPRTRSMRVVFEGGTSALKVGLWGSRGVRIGEDLVDLTDTTLSGDPARLRAMAALLKRAALEAPTWRPVDDVLSALESAAERTQLDRLCEPGLVDLAGPSRLQIAAALVRWKRVVFRVDAGRLSPTSEDPL